MTLFIIAYLGGALTILSPCILPVLPFVFTRFDQPFVKSGLPLLLGMALVPAISALRTFPAVWTNTGPNGRRRNRPLAAELYGVQNAYAPPKGPNRFSFHAAKLWPRSRSIKGATESESFKGVGSSRRASAAAATRHVWMAFPASDQHSA